METLHPFTDDSSGEVVAYVPRGAEGPDWTTVVETGEARRYDRLVEGDAGWADVVRAAAGRAMASGGVIDPASAPRVSGG